MCCCSVKNEFLIELVRTEIFYFSLANHDVLKSQMLLVQNAKLPVPDGWMNILTTTAAWTSFELPIIGVIL